MLPIVGLLDHAAELAVFIDGAAIKVSDPDPIWTAVAAYASGSTGLGYSNEPELLQLPEHGPNVSKRNPVFDKIGVSDGQTTIVISAMCQVFEFKTG
jgi:hypothetical protein